MRRGRTEANPFVVLADLSIALTFLFAVISIAFSREQSERQRNEMQKQDRLQLTGKIAEVLSQNAGDVRNRCLAQGAELDCSDPRVEIHLLYTSWSQTAPTVAVYRNASYVRLMLRGSFEPGATALASPYSGVLEALANQIWRLYNDGKIPYITIQGTAEVSESTEKLDRDRLAAARAEFARKAFVIAGKVPSDQEVEIYERSRQKGESFKYWRKLDKIDPGRVLSMGKENLYRAGDKAGRVDFILFYRDKLGDE